MDSTFFSQFLLLAAAHLLAVISPGADFAIVVRQSITFGKRSAIYTSAGIGCAILIHVLYSVLGVGLLIAQSELLFSLLKYLCAGYLLYLGIAALRTKRDKISSLAHSSGDDMQQSRSKSFGLGFLTNALNPKATLFFLSIFSVIVSTDTPLWWLLCYAVYLCSATTLWFCFVSLVFSKRSVRDKFMVIGHYFDRIMAALFIMLAINVAWAEL